MYMAGGGGGRERERESFLIISSVHDSKYWLRKVHMPFIPSLKSVPNVFSEVVLTLGLTDKGPLSSLQDRLSSAVPFYTRLNQAVHGVLA